VTPSAERATKRLFVVQLALGEQSDHATYTAPSAPTSADGSGATRSPGIGWNDAGATGIGGNHVTPPSSDRNAEIWVWSK